MRERLAHQFVAERERGRPVQRVEHLRIIARVNHHEHVAEVLRGRPHQAGSADVDLLDQLLEPRTRVLRGLGERIEVHDDDVDRLDPLLRDRPEILRVIAPRQDAAMDGGVQGFDPALHHLGKARDVRHAGHGQARFGQRARRAAGRDQLESARRQRMTEGDDSGFVRNAQQGSWHRRQSPVLFE